MLSISTEFKASFTTLRMKTVVNVCRLWISRIALQNAYLKPVECSSRRGRVLGNNEVAFLTRSAGRARFTFFNERPATPGVRIGMATVQYRCGGFGVV